MAGTAYSQTTIRESRDPSITDTYFGRRQSLESYVARSSGRSSRFAEHLGGHFRDEDLAGFLTDSGSTLGTRDECSSTLGSRRGNEPRRRGFLSMRSLRKSPAQPSLEVADSQRQRGQSGKARKASTECENREPESSREGRGRRNVARRVKDWFKGLVSRPSTDELKGSEESSRKQSHMGRHPAHKKRGTRSYLMWVNNTVLCD